MHPPSLSGTFDKYRKRTKQEIFLTSVDSKTGLLHSSTVTATNVHDSQELPKHMHCDETRRSTVNQLCIGTICDELELICLSKSSLELNAGIKRLIPRFLNVLLANVSFQFQSPRPFHYGQHSTRDAQDKSSAKSIR